MKGTLEQQLQYEDEMKESALTKYINTFYNQLNKGGINDTMEGRIFHKIGFEAITNKIQQYLDTPTTGTRKKDKNHILNICDDSKVLAYVTIAQILPMVVRHGNRAPLATVGSNIMKGLYAEYVVTRLKEQDPKLFKYMDSAYRRASKKRKELLMRGHIKNMKDRSEGLMGLTAYHSAPEVVRAGVALIDCVFASGCNLFERRSIMDKGHRKYVVSMTNEGREILEVSHANIITKLEYNYPPLVVPPRPWTSNYSGGMYNKETPIMKMKTKEGHKALRNTPIPKVYPVLNKLQNTAWRINRFVVDVIHDIFNDNMVDPRSPRNLPRLYGGLPTNTPIDVDELIRKETYGTVNSEGKFEDVKAFVRWRRDTEAVKIALDGEMGRRLHLLSAIGEAQKFMDYDELYFAYTLDSRGRVYTMQAIITPQSSAEVKAMLEFAEGQMLDERGLYWLKIHTANVYGKDKEDFDERISWFDENVADILATGTTPLSCIGNWCYCDSPFEYLAACKAYKDYTEGKPVHLGIQLDATNSGVQIYSGLLGDLEGAKTVNVVNTGKREDVYGIVAHKVNRLLEEGAYPGAYEVGLSDGTTKRQPTLREAKSITGKISRSIVKRNVMTVPYSVSRRGMSQQLWDIMDDARLHEKEWWEGDPWVVNKLLTDLNHEAIYDTIKGAKVGQDYLVALADMCNNKDGMMYTTPIYEIPVVQKKPRVKINVVQTLLGTLNLVDYVPNSLDRLAQRNGSAPNYIHSIDSTLLLRVIETMSVQIGVIHDCFIVPPNSGDEVQTKFKEAYVEIMKMKPLELLGKQLDPDGFIEVPYIGTLDLDDVLDSEYIIS